MLRVLVVDDHPLARAGMVGELKRVGGMEIVGEAHDVDSAIQAAHEIRPDIVLLDVHLPGGQGGGGAEVVSSCQNLYPGTKILAISVSDAAKDVVGVVRAGARGYVTKDVTGEKLADAIRRVADGDAAFSARLAGFVLDAFGASKEDVAQSDDELNRLSAREQEVMRLIARGLSYKEVASDLFISIKTVETHVSAVLRKLQLSNRHELARWAAARRLV
ncbi:MAG: response regulator [Ancrocorticia sp.]|uniref:response regulator n=1 Tax=Ancrocorticia sp. TaxID=2593684 RepID=UPI003F91C888